MVLVPLSEAKAYLRINSSDDDALIDILLSTAKHMCADVAKLDPNKWAVVSGETENEDMYTDEELEQIRKMVKAVILYAVGYLFEYREKADHHDLVMTLRHLLFDIREGMLSLCDNATGDNLDFEFKIAKVADSID